MKDKLKKDKALFESRLDEFSGMSSGPETFKDGDEISVILYRKLSNLEELKDEARETYADDRPANGYIAKTVELSNEDFETWTQDFYQRAPFIQNFRPNPREKPIGMIQVYPQGQPEKRIIVDTQGYSYARYTGIKAVKVSSQIQNEADSEPQQYTNKIDMPKYPQEVFKKDNFRVIRVSTFGFKILEGDKLVGKINTRLRRAVYSLKTPEFADFLYSFWNDLKDDREHKYGGGFDNLWIGDIGLKLNKDRNTVIFLEPWRFF